MLSHGTAAPYAFQEGTLVEEAKTLLDTNALQHSMSSLSLSSLSSASSNEESSDERSPDTPMVQRPSSKLAKCNGSSRISDPSKKKTSINRRHQIHRGARRLMRIFFLILLFVCFSLLTLYISLYSNMQMRQTALLDWGPNVSRNTAEYVLPDNNTTLIEPPGVCQQKYFVMIIVCSSLGNFAARQMIRETWGNTTEFNYDVFSMMHEHMKDRYLDPSLERIQLYSEFLGIHKNATKVPAKIPVKVLFLVGRSMYDNAEMSERVHNESLRYQDILQENFVDTYNNLTLKTVFALKWITKRCLNQIAFLMKCDDDTFVNIPNLLHFLLGGTIPVYNDTLDLYDVRTFKALAPTNRLNKTNGYLTGHLFCSAKPIASVDSKWYMPFYMYPEDTYPKYLSGAGYLMSNDVVPRLYEAALNTTLIYLEDVYVTGVCAERVLLTRLHQPLFSFLRAKALCSFKGSITQHHTKDDALMETYAFVIDATNRCPPPGSIFKRLPLRRNVECN